MCYEPGGLWVVELTKVDNAKTMTLDADTKITNICLNHEGGRRDESSRSSIKLTSNGHTGTICTLTPGKTEQALTDILLPKGAMILLELVGSSAVFVTGYRIRSTCLRAGNVKTSQRTTDSTASRRSIETMSPPSVPLKRSPGSFSDSDPHPTTDHRRAGPAQASTLPIDSKAKASTSSFPSPGPHFQFQAHNPTPRSLQVPPPHPGTSGAPPTDTFYNTRPPTLQTDSQITRTITVTNSKASPYQVEITERAVGLGAEVTESSSVAFQLVIRDPRDGRTLKSETYVAVHMHSIRNMVPGVYVGLIGMKVGGARRVQLPALSRVGWGPIQGIPDEFGHILELKLSAAN